MGSRSDCGVTINRSNVKAATSYVRSATSESSPAFIRSVEQYMYLLGWFIHHLASAYRYILSLFSLSDLIGKQLVIFSLPAYSPESYRRGNLKLFY